MANLPISDELRRRLDSVQKRLQHACQRVGRKEHEVTLIAVTKTVSPEIAEAVVKHGVVDLGESRPQELWRKAGLLPKNIHWHLIGHLQRNKISQTLPLAHLIHSVDSIRLITALEDEGKRLKQLIPVLLEINASKEINKHGFSPEEISLAVPELKRLEHVQVQGLMTMAAFEEDPERCRSTFQILANLRQEIRSLLKAPHDLSQLSMGMSNDFEVAVEEGATMVRIGTLLFDGLSS